MGRKSHKAKEKKQKRKEETAKLATKIAIVKCANSVDDPMESFAPFKKFERNGVKLTIECCRVSSLDEETKRWAFKLTKDNMQLMYENSDWGWDDKVKYEEMTDDSAYYLIVRDDVGKRVACVHFRFDTDWDDAVLYCYEIQLLQEVRRKGLGKFLMQILQLLANKFNMEKVMVTVFKQNEGAFKFFMDTLKYEVDETSPQDTLGDTLYEDPDLYTCCILSKPCGARRQTSAPSQQPTALTEQSLNTQKTSTLSQQPTALTEQSLNTQKT